MKYSAAKDFIEISGDEDFMPEHILECGQIFSYEKTGSGYDIYSLDKRVSIEQTEKGYMIRTDDVPYFENFFDLKTDYGEIKRELEKYKILQEPIRFGHGIRILKQNLFETLISFIISSNNNIKRIQLILTGLRKRLGVLKEGYYTFPTEKALANADEHFFAEVGAGYRAKYLYKVVRQIDGDILEEWRTLPTLLLREKLIKLAGVGPKVADCVLLFGYGRGDVFPVDIWISRMYNKFYPPLNNREQIQKNLVREFGYKSGYAQQYLFYFMRSGIS